VGLGDYGLASGLILPKGLSFNIPDVLQHYDPAFSHMFSSSLIFPFLSRRLPERPGTGQYTRMKLVCAMYKAYYLSSIGLFRVIQIAYISTI
jgi:hypothetical protein